MFIVNDNKEGGGGRGGGETNNNKVRLVNQQIVRPVCPFHMTLLKNSDTIGLRVHPGHKDHCPFARCMASAS